MKTERNGILETFIRKLFNFMETPYFWLISFLSCCFFSVVCFLASVGTFSDLADLSFSYLDIDVFIFYLKGPFCFGVYLAFSFVCFIYLIFSIRDLRKSSAEADKNKNENKDD